MSTEYRLKIHLGLDFQVAEGTQSTAYTSFFDTSDSLLLPNHTLSSSPTMATAFHATSTMAELSMSTSPISDHSRPPMLRKPKLFATQSTEHLSNHSPRQGRGTANIPCKFFKNDACTAGINCPFLHSSNPDHASTTICKYYLKGSCKFGNKCALLHSIPTTSPNIYGSPMSSRLMSRGASAESAWDPVGMNDSSSLLSDTGSNKEGYYFPDIFPSCKDASPIASNAATPNIDNRRSSPRTPIYPSLNSAEPYSTSSSITDGYGALYAPQGRTIFQRLSPRSSVMTSLTKGNHFNDEWGPQSYASQNTTDYITLARSFDEIFATTTSELSSKTIRRPYQPLRSIPDSQPTSYPGLTGTLFTDKLSSITSQSHELELTKDILRMRDDRRRASEPSTGLEMTDSKDTTDITQPTDTVSEDFDEQMESEIEMPFLMD
ncbi:hypothetical protein BGW37DRAFT_515484 [Umbelopsis sp. PMI_123]|nr:hypothetical protein BGW37DRAFT_515484 [Umbelopsis sp. PMI_123]